MTLSGNSQYVSLPTGIVSGLSSFSITAWVKLASSPTWNRIFDLGNDTTTYMFLTPNDSSTMRFSITTAGATMEQQINATSLPTGSWQHVAVTLAGGVGSVYVQGAEVAQNTAVTLSPSSLGSTTRNWLGRSEFSVDPYLNGQLDNVRIYSRALTAGRGANVVRGPPLMTGREESRQAAKAAKDAGIWGALSILLAPSRLRGLAASPSGVRGSGPLTKGAHSTPRAAVGVSSGLPRTAFFCLEPMV